MILTAIVITLGVTAFLLAGPTGAGSCGQRRSQDDAEDRVSPPGGGGACASTSARETAVPGDPRPADGTGSADRSAGRTEEAERAILREQIARRDLDERLEAADDKDRERIIFQADHAQAAALDEAKRRVREARKELAEHRRADREYERRLRRELRQRIRAQKRQLRASIRAERERLARAEDSDMQGVDY